MSLIDKIYNCGMYLRLSREDLKKCDESSSIQSQRLIIKGFAKHNNFKIIDEYVDDGYSGSNFERPGFKKMISDIESGKINCVITKDLSRLGREMYKTGKYIEEYFLEHNIRYIAINDSFDSNIGDAMLGIRLGVNDLYLRDVSKKVRTSFRVKQERGEYIGSIACFGYKKDQKDHHKLVIDEEASKVVKYIFKLYLDGYGCSKICKKLTDEKIPIPVVYKRETRGLNVVENDGFGVWKSSTVKNILKSQMYIGNMVQHVLEKVSYNQKKTRRVNDENQIIVKNTHEAIISLEDFNKVQKIINSRTHCETPKNYDKYLFSGLMICGTCGHTLGISCKKRKSSDSLYTYCNYYQRKGVYSNCTPNRLNYKNLEEDILDYLKNLLKTSIENIDKRKMIEEILYVYNKKNDELNHKLILINTKIEKVNKIISNLYNDKIDEIISNETYKNLSRENEERLLEYQKEKKYIENMILFTDSKSFEKNLIECRKYVEDFLNLVNPTKDVIKKLVNRVVIFDNKNNKTVKVYFNFSKLS